MRVQISVDPLVAVFAVLYALAGSLWQWAVVFGSLVVHEAAHAVVAAGFGLAALEVRITPIGAAIRIDSGMELRPEAEAAVAMAGPMTSLVLAGAGYIFLACGQPDARQAEFFIGANIVLALLNLVPAYPLDGGRVLRALLAERMGVSRATRAAVSVSRWIGGLAILAGAIGAVAQLVNPLAMAMGALILIEANREARTAPYADIRRAMRRRAGLLGQELMTMPTTLMAAGARARACAVLRRLTGLGFAIVSVVDSRGSEIGRLTEIELLDGVSACGPDVDLGTLVRNARSIRGSKH